MTFLLKLATLPLIALLTLMEWLGIFALSISQFITNKLAALIFFIACCCLLFGKVTLREAAAMFAGSFCVFALPYAAEWILERISDFNRCVKDWQGDLIQKGEPRLKQKEDSREPLKPCVAYGGCLP